MESLPIQASFLKKKNHSSLKENVIETPQENSARFFFLNAAS